MSRANEEDLSLVTIKTEKILSNPQFYLRNIMKDKRNLHILIGLRINRNLSIVRVKVEVKLK